MVTSQPDSCQTRVDCPEIVVQRALIETGAPSAAYVHTASGMASMIAARPSSAFAVSVEASTSSVTSETRREKPRTTPFSTCRTYASRTSQRRPFGSISGRWMNCGLPWSTPWITASISAYRSAPITSRMWRPRRCSWSRPNQARPTSPAGTFRQSRSQ